MAYLCPGLRQRPEERGLSFSCFKNVTHSPLIMALALILADCRAAPLISFEDPFTEPRWKGWVESSENVPSYIEGNDLAATSRLSTASNPSELQPNGFNVWFHRLIISCWWLCPVWFAKQTFSMILKPLFLGFFQQFP